MTQPVLRVGIIGCGEVAQVIHIPTINNLAHNFRTTYLCDVSPQSLAFCATRVQGHTPTCTADARELCASPDVDVVLVCNADAYHVPHAVMALENDKFVLIEKPAALCFRDLDILVAAERRSKGRVFVGTMRRFATTFTDAVKEVGGMDKIQYARVRDIIGPNAYFVDQSGMYPQRFTDVSETDRQDRCAREKDIFEQALGNELGVPVTTQTTTLLEILGSLGTHDLSAMREILGMPRSVAGAVLTFPGIFCVLFQYDGFPVTYESGINDVPEFDAHIEVYSPEKIVRVDYDTPYVKGLPITMTVREKVGKSGFQERKIRRTYQDPFTTEYLQLYDVVVNGKEPKTSAADARNDITLYGMIVKAGANASVH
ncbi:oxidoreductase [Niveomyces insectorum RCEF 264]|uniref:Oxidoreductase n=1 Tax=Niveomyces insectorum RCEF 264 TaxID=1081102 RepID=A0A167M512_9HYPO|nr:oxidoreductase [Niveomyces insectorum RCEF 264]